MSDSESSELSSAPSEDETLQLKKKNGILKFFAKVPGPVSGATSKTAVPKSPPRPKRAPSPEHEPAFADNQDIAFIVMFRSRFTEAFPKSLANFGPQELERDVINEVPGEHAEQFLCAVLGLLLNRKQDVKAGHYNRALEEAVQTHKSQWAKDWDLKNPLSGGATFASMAPTQRLTLLRTLILWSLSSSDVIKGIITASYKQSRHEDDLNQPLSVQPWGSDGDKRRYFLIEGLDDTHFRVYRESNHTGIKRTWYSVAGDIEELKTLAEKLEKVDGGQKARSLSARMVAAVPRFEATEEKRKRREYRQIRKQQFRNPETNFSMYEGRTRGKRMRYTYSEGEEDEGYSDATTSRRSTRTTGTHTPAEGLAPTVTLSGRQVKARQGGTYGESMLSGRTRLGSLTAGFDGTSEEPEDEVVDGRPRRAAAAKATNGWNGGRAHIDGYNSVDEMDSDEENDASEQDYGDDEEEDDIVSLASDADDIEELSEDDEILDGVEKKSLVIKLQVKNPRAESRSTTKLQEDGLAGSSMEAVSVPASTPNPEPAKDITTTGAVSTLETAEDSILANGTAVLVPEDDIAPKIRSPLLQPTSPLAFRGSPEKLTSFPVGVTEER